jgi:acyl dehydratase
MAIPECRQPYFDEIAAGEPLPARQFGPLTIISTVRWAGLQENTARLHYDRDYVREHSGLKTFIASGAYRQALLVRMLTDWIGPLGQLRKLSLRHLHPTFEGDMIRYSGQVVEKAAGANPSWIACALEGKNQDERPILTGRCTVILPRRAG